MTPTEVGKAYDRIAQRWVDGEWLAKRIGIDAHERAIGFLQAKRRALDVGCGAGRIAQLLAERGFDTEGIDVSGEMLRLARQTNPTVRFHQADICEWALPRRYDLISAWDSIWHVPLAAQEALLTKLLGGLAPGGVLIFTCGGDDSPAEHVDSEMGPDMYYSTIGVPRILALVAAANCSCRHLEYDQHPERHVVVIAQRR